MKFAFYTLGCKTNQYETQAMERLLTDMGHEIGHFDESCDAYVINTCSVTAVADKKNRAVIRRCRRENPVPSSASAAASPSTPRRPSGNWASMSSAAAETGRNLLTGCFLPSKAFPSGKGGMAKP